MESSPNKVHTQQQSTVAVSLLHLVSQDGVTNNPESTSAAAAAPVISDRKRMYGRACSVCRASKARCDGQRPCARCHEKGTIRRCLDTPFTPPPVDNVPREAEVPLPVKVPPLTMNEPTPAVMSHVSDISGCGDRESSVRRHKQQQSTAAVSLLHDLVSQDGGVTNNPEPAAAPHISDRKRMYGRACSMCRASKTRCDGQRPCARCHEKGTIRECLETPPPTFGVPRQYKSRKRRAPKPQAAPQGTKKKKSNENTNDHNTNNGLSNASSSSSSSSSSDVSFTPMPPHASESVTMEQDAVVSTPKAHVHATPHNQSRDTERVTEQGSMCHTFWQWLTDDAHVAADAAAAAPATNPLTHEVTTVHVDTDTGTGAGTGGRTEAGVKAGPDADERVL